MDVSIVSGADLMVAGEYLCKKEAAGSLNMSTIAKKIWELHSFAAYAIEKREDFSVPENYEDHFFPWLKRIRTQEKFVHCVPLEDMDKLYKAAPEHLFYSLRCK